MAKQNDAKADKPGIIVRIREFYQEVLVEMNKVAWPSKDEVKSHTMVVMFMLLVMAAITYFYDFVSLHAVKLLLKLG